MDLDDILAITHSGVREGEEEEITALLGGDGLHTEDISADVLRNFIVARKGAQVVGVAGLEISGGCALLRSLAVLEDFRGRNVASDLTASIEKYAMSRGVETLYLLTETAEGFFARLGYEKADRSAAPQGIQSTKEFSVFCPSSAVCMVKRISPSATSG